MNHVYEFKIFICVFIVLNFIYACSPCNQKEYKEKSRCLFAEKALKSLNPGDLFFIDNHSYIFKKQENGLMWYAKSNWPDSDGTYDCKKLSYIACLATDIERQSKSTNSKE